MNKCQLPYCEEVVRKALSYALYAYQILLDKKAKTVNILNGEDIAEETLEIVRDICGTTDMFLLANKLEKKRSKQDKDRKDGEEVSEDGTESEEGVSEDGTESEEEVAKDGTMSKEGKDSQKENDDHDEDEDSKAEDMKKDAQKGEEKTTFSHHLNRKCLVKKGCAGYHGPNLKRHLINVHLKKNHITEADVDRYFQMGVDAKNKRGPPRKNKKGKPMKGRWKRWCPIPNCSYLGAYLSEHLLNKHRMKQSSATYRNSLKVAKRYKGKADEIESMVEPEPPICELSVPSPPSKRARLSDDDSDAGPSKRKVKKPRPLDSDSESDSDIIPPTPAKTPASSNIIPTSEALSDAASNDENDDDDTYPMQADYFTAESPENKRHSWLIAYYKYLFTPSSGFHKEKIAFSTPAR